jgi:hypothetical protein
MAIEKKIIQLGGTVRSGTTMLALILANSEDAISLGEVIHLFEPYKKAHLAEIERLIKNPKWNKILNDKKENLYANIFNVFPEVNIILDSSKDPFWYNKLRKNNSFETKQLVTYKNPTDLKQSFLKRGMTNWRKVYLNYYRRFFTVFPLANTIYLDKILNDDNYLKDLCIYLEVEYFDNKLEYWHKVQPNFFGSKTVKQNKIDSTILKEVKEEQIDDKRVKTLFQDLEKKQFIYPSTDINYKYSNVMLKSIRLKDQLIKKVKYDL